MPLHGLWARDTEPMVCIRIRGPSDASVFLTFAIGVCAIARFFSRTHIHTPADGIMRVQVHDAPPQGHCIAPSHTHICIYIYASARARASRDGLRRT